MTAVDTSVKIMNHLTSVLAVVSNLGTCDTSVKNTLPKIGSCVTGDTSVKIMNHLTSFLAVVSNLATCDTSAKNTLLHLTEFDRCVNLTHLHTAGRNQVPNINLLDW